MTHEKDIGLCHSCARARVIRSSKDSVFYLCERSIEDPRFPKYPSLPVLTCRGYEEREPEKRDAGEK